MSGRQGTSTSTSYDLSTLAMMRAVLDDAWLVVQAQKRDGLTKSELAERILRHAAAGERDPLKLRAAALTAQDGQEQRQVPFTST